MPTVEERVRVIVTKELSLSEEELEERADFLEELKADSLDLVQMIMTLEDAFKDEVDEEYREKGGEFKIPDEDVENIHNIKDVVAYLKERGVSD